jgi:hypothetical protein
MKRANLNWSWMVISILAMLLAVGLVACEDDNDVAKDEGDTGDLEPVDDDDDDTSGGDDDDDIGDDDDDDLLATELYIEPAGEAVPAGTSADFDAVVVYENDTFQRNPDGVVWEIADENTASVNDGFVNGLVDGTTTLTASFGEAKELLSDTVDLLVGPDIYLYDSYAATIDAIDREAQTFTEDWLGAGAIATVPNDLTSVGAFAYLTDSGDFGPGITGGEKVVEIDLYAKTATDITLGSLDSPWSSTIYDGFIWVTGNLSDNLAKIDLLDTSSIEYIDLPTDCVPGKLTGAAGKIYVSCSGFLGVGNYEPGKVAVYDPESKGTTTVDLTQVNPGSILATEDESAVYVVCVGDFDTKFGAINRIETTGDTVENSFDIGGSLGNAALTANGRLFVLDWKDMYVIDTNNDDAVLRGEADPVLVGTDGSWLAGIHAHQDLPQVIVSNQEWVTYVHTVEVISAVDYSVLHSYDLSATSASPGAATSW